MSDIPLNSILGLSPEEVNNSKIELNMQADGDSFIDRWLFCDDEHKEKGTCPQCGYWGWYGDKKNFQIGQWVFCFIRLRDDEWLFISAGEIIEVPPKSHARFTVIEKFKPYFGRLIIQLVKGQKFARYIFNLSTYLGSCRIKTILPTLYGGDDFPGYDSVRLSYKQLETIILHGKRDWIAALENQKAVYLLTDISNGKMYVGSATSDRGMLLQRWRNYIKNGHGDNIELTELVARKGFDHIKANFYFSILENYNAKISDSVILERESWWKKVLLTRKVGYNRN